MNLVKVFNKQILFNSQACIQRLLKNQKFVVSKHR